MHLDGSESWTAGTELAGGWRTLGSRLVGVADGRFSLWKYSDKPAMQGEEVQVGVSAVVSLELPPALRPKGR